MNKKGWRTKTLGEACLIARGGSPRPIQEFMTNDPDGVNWVKISDATASGKYIYTTKEKIKPAGVPRSRLVKPGDFLLSNSMSFGRPYIMQTTGCIHDGWLVLSGYENSFDQSFLYHLLGSPVVFEQFDTLAAGSTVRNLNIELASCVSLPVPPLPEQHRIVAILDAAFDHIATAKANCEANLLNARAIFEIHLQAVFTQRGDGWEEQRLGDIFNIGSSKRILETEWTTAGVPFYGGREIVKLAKSGAVLSNSYISEEKYCDYASKYDMPRQDDILITARGTIGVGYVVQEGDKFYYKDGNIISMRGKAPTNPYFMLYAFRSNVMAEQLGNLAGTTVKHLPIEKAKELILRIPKFVMQNTVVEQIREVETETQRLESLYQRKLQALDDLKKSLLHQAFSGAL
jgi:type I restriction enzyme, S subunit